MHMNVCRYTWTHTNLACGWPQQSHSRHSHSPIVQGHARSQRGAESSSNTVQSYASHGLSKLMDWPFLGYSSHTLQIDKCILYNN